MDGKANYCVFHFFKFEIKQIFIFLFRAYEKLPQENQVNSNDDFNIVVS